MKIDMKNIAYTAEYRQQREQRGAIFSGGYHKSTETLTLAYGYSAARRHYYGKIGGCNITASETVLMDSSDAEIYRWRNLDDGGDFAEMIRHSDGRLYLIFRIDLYGYGVYDLAGGSRMGGRPPHAGRRL
ncbi:MAG: hypothetical protein LBP78_07370 [Acidaminococcales bacterium]|jgi:hypothetical protein|nr:hypothetical protein [Acidaminococcales bacterium]